MSYTTITTTVIACDGPACTRQLEANRTRIASTGNKGRPIIPPDWLLITQAGNVKHHFCNWRCLRAWAHEYGEMAIPAQLRTQFQWGAWPA